MTRSVHQLITDGDVCRTAPATPGLLNTTGFHELLHSFLQGEGLVLGLGPSFHTDTAGLTRGTPGLTGFIICVSFYHLGLAEP